MLQLRMTKMQRPREGPASSEARAAPSPPPAPPPRRRILFHSGFRDLAHCVASPFSLSLQDPDNLVTIEQTVGKLTFVDLAGSERLKKSQARSAGSRGHLPPTTAPPRARSVALSIPAR